MKIFDHKGMMIIPTLPKQIPVNTRVLVLKEVYCPNGHNLIDPHADFNHLPGIILKVRKGRKSGQIALSPVYGEKIRVAMNIELIQNETVRIFCPTCGVELPAYSSCSCGADQVALFLHPLVDFSNCVGICTRVDCTHAQITSQGELITQSMIESHP